MLLFPLLASAYGFYQDPGKTRRGLLLRIPVILNIVRVTSTRSKPQRGCPSPRDMTCAFAEVRPDAIPLRDHAAARGEVENIGSAVCRFVSSRGSCL